MPTFSVRVKICGLLEEEHLRAAIDSGADLLGFVFAPSRRQVQPLAARRLLDRMPPGRAEAVGIFVDASPADINDIAAYCHLDWAQLCGQETPLVCSQVQVPVIKAFRTGPSLEISHLAEYEACCRVFLLDAFAPGQHGGTGQRCDWVLAAKMSRLFPVLLAGGLNPDNVAEAIRTVRPWGVDVSSGVETCGAKDPSLIAAFVASAKNETASEELLARRQVGED